MELPQNDAGSSIKLLGRILEEWIIAALLKVINGFVQYILKRYKQIFEEGGHLMDVLSKATKVAILAVKEAGKLAKEYFHKEKQIVEKGDHGDLVTLVDHLAEDIILKSILAHFPDHQIRSEETGWTGSEGEWLWLVDPLDGTNNYAVGIPVYGVSITLIYKKEPVLGVIYESHLDNLYVAEKGKGATCNGTPLSIKNTAITKDIGFGITMIS